MPLTHVHLQLTIDGGQTTVVNSLELYSGSNREQKTNRGLTVEYESSCGIRNVIAGSLRFSPAISRELYGCLLYS